MSWWKAEEGFRTSVRISRCGELFRRHVDGEPRAILRLCAPLPTPLTASRAAAAPRLTTYPLRSPPITSLPSAGTRQPEAVPQRPDRKARDRQAQMGHGVQGLPSLRRRVHEPAGAPSRKCALLLLLLALAALTSVLLPAPARSWPAPRSGSTATFRASWARC